jgi:hypothetical protein
MSMAGSFLGGAKNRLLPASVPFSFFLAASGFHVLAWATLFAGASEVPGYAGGTGMVLASIHLLTLGVLSLTAMGASYQLFPVVTRQPLVRVWPARLGLAAMISGIPLLTAGMAWANPPVMAVGGGLVAGGLILFAWLTAHNLTRAGSMPVVAAHGWGALIALLGLMAIALVLIGDFSLGFLVDHAGLALIHMVLGGFGFMGLLVLGLSLVLIPMFVLSRAQPSRMGWVQLVMTGAALTLFSLGVWLDIRLLSLSAFVPGIAAIGTYIWLMRETLRTSMRKRLGPSFFMIRLSWGLLVLALLTGLAVTGGLPVPNGPALFGFLGLVGWLLTFLTGVLQRIMPFLASMHGSTRSGAPALLSDLTAETPLRAHVACHLVALVLVSLGIVTDQVVVVQVGAASGFLGSLAFATFAINVMLKLKIPS